MRSKLSMLLAGVLTFALPGAAFAAKDLVVGVPSQPHRVSIRRI